MMATERRCSGKHDKPTAYAKVEGRMVYSEA